MEKKKKWYATKWYKCLQCGCLWEFDKDIYYAKAEENKRW